MSEVGSAVRSSNLPRLPASVGARLTERKKAALFLETQQETVPPSLAHVEVSVVIVMPTILEQIADIEAEVRSASKPRSGALASPSLPQMARTQRNKATERHFGVLKAKLAKLRRELITPKGGSSGPGEGFDVAKTGDARIGFVGRKLSNTGIEVSYF